MALILRNYEDPFGRINETVYIRVTRTDIDWANKQCQFQISYFSSQEARNANKQPLFIKDFELDGQMFVLAYTSIMVNQQNPLQAAYNFLKQLPDFNEAEDS